MTFVRRFLSSMTIAFAVAASCAPAGARTIYDGLWSVLISTDAGVCDPAYRYPVRIVNGTLRRASEDDAAFVIGGRVRSRGAVNVTVRRGDRQATGTGRLSRSDGSGVWSAPSGPCSGRWVAERRR